MLEFGLASDGQHSKQCYVSSQARFDPETAEQMMSYTLTKQTFPLDW